MDNKFDCTGRTALVSGASSGLGAHFAKLLAEHGARVIVAARRVDRLQALADEIELNGGEALAVQMDVCEADSVRAAFDRAEDAYGPVDIVSNNAGVVDQGLAVDIDEERWDFVLDTNLKGAWLVARESGRRMIDAGTRGSIVNTASVLGLRVARGLSTYATSKAALIQLTRTLALEWCRKGIRVNALCPGYFLTEINAWFLESEAGRDYIGNTPAQRMGAMREIEAPFMLLASEAGSFINGVALPVDGGHMLGGL